MQKSRIYLFVVLGLVFLLAACTPYRHLEMTSDTFLSHKIWKENQSKYVYLVHDGEDSYLYNSVVLVQDSAQKTVKRMEGVLDTISEQKQKELKRIDERRVVHLYVSNPDSLDFESGESLDIDRSNLNKVVMKSKRKGGILGGVLGILGAIVVIFVFLVLLLFVALLSASADGSTSNSDPDCYVATMVYGSTEADQVLKLRRFRDQYLLPNKYGRSFVTWYYANSPAFVERHQSKIWLHRMIRFVLNAFVSLLK